MNKITINGKTFSVQGNNITLNGDSIQVDGKVIESGLSGEVKVKFEGDLANIDCNDLEVQGNIKGNVDCTNIKCNNIDGDVDCTNLQCQTIYGNIDATKVQCMKHIGETNY
jgi:cytoskeletal protein CcmA (bactofilin family)